jgi:hypothetical protein
VISIKCQNRKWQNDTLTLLLIEVGSSESHELLNSFWMGPGGSWDPRGVERTPRCGLAAPPKSLHTLRSVFHTENASKSLCADDFRALDLLLESARGAGSKPHATPIGARTTAIHLVNALGGKKVRSRRARDIKLPLAPLSSSHLMTPVPMLPSQVKHLAYYSGAFALSLRRDIEGTLPATERHFLPARRCVLGALPPSWPGANLPNALCAAFKPGGGRGAAANEQRMCPGHHGSGASRHRAAGDLHMSADCARARLSEHVCFGAAVREPVSAPRGPPWALAAPFSTVCPGPIRFLAVCHLAGPATTRHGVIRRRIGGRRAMEMQARSGAGAARGDAVSAAVGFHVHGP